MKSVRDEIKEEFIDQFLLNQKIPKVLFVRNCCPTNNELSMNIQITQEFT